MACYTNHLGMNGIFIAKLLTGFLPIGTAACIRLAARHGAAGAPVPAACGDLRAPIGRT